MEQKQLQLSTVRALATSAGEFFALLSNICLAVSAALIELERVRESAKKGFQGLYFPDFLMQLAQIDQQLADTISAATVDRFDFGNLSITVDEGPGGCLAMFGRERLKEALRTVYGADFKVRIRQGR